MGSGGDMRHTVVIVEPIDGDDGATVDYLVDSQYRQSPALPGQPSTAIRTSCWYTLPAGTPEWFESDSASGTAGRSEFSGRPVFFLPGFPRCSLSPVKKVPAVRLLFHRPASSLWENFRRPRPGRFPPGKNAPSLYNPAFT